METYEEIRAFFSGLGILLDHLGEMDTFVEGQDLKKGYNEQNYEELEKLVNLFSSYVKEPYFDWLNLFMIDKTQDQIKAYIFDLFGNVLRFNDQDFCEMLKFAGVTVDIIDDDISIHKPNPDVYISEQSETITKAIEYLYRIIMILATTTHNICMVHGIETFQLQYEYDKLMKNIAFDDEDVGITDDYFTSKLLFTPVVVNEEKEKKKERASDLGAKYDVLRTLLAPENDKLRERWYNLPNRHKAKLVAYLLNANVEGLEKRILAGKYDNHIRFKDHTEKILKECSIIEES